MDTPTDNTLSIHPLNPNTQDSWTPSRPQPANNQPAADEARLKIEQIARPTYQGSAPAALGGESSKLLYPKPVSPAEQELHHLPSLPQMPRHYHKLKPILSALASFLLILMLFKAPVLITQIKFLTSSHTSPDQIIPPTNNVAEVVPAEPTITIPKINVNAPVIYPTSTANSPNYDPELENGVVHYPNTALPGQNGNVVVFGHSSNDWWEPGNYKFVFVLLDKLVPGDTFSINFNSKRYIYQVTNTKIVEASDLSVLAPSQEPIVTLITCWPAGTSLKRQIVVGKQISPSTDTATPAAQTTPSNTPVLPGSSPSLWQQFQQFFQGVKDSLSNKPATVNAAAPSNN